MKTHSYKRTRKIIRQNSLFTISLLCTSSSWVLTSGLLFLLSSLSAVRNLPVTCSEKTCDVAVWQKFFTYCCRKSSYCHLSLSKLSRYLNLKLFPLTSPGGNSLTAHRGLQLELAGCRLANLGFQVWLWAIAQCISSRCTLPLWCTLGYTFISTERESVCACVRNIHCLQPGILKLWIGVIFPSQLLEIWAYEEYQPATKRFPENRDLPSSACIRSETFMSFGSKYFKRIDQSRNLISRNLGVSKLSLKNKPHPTKIAINYRRYAARPETERSRHPRHQEYWEWTITPLSVLQKNWRETYEITKCRDIDAIRHQDHHSPPSFLKRQVQIQGPKTQAHKKSRKTNSYVHHDRKYAIPSSGENNLSSRRRTRSRLENMPRH